MSEDEEASEIVFVCLDAFPQHFHSVDFGGVAMTDGSVSQSMLPADIGCSPCCVGHFDYLEVRMTSEKLATLHECDGMRVNFGKVFPILFGQTHNAMTDAELVFAHNRHTAVSQQFVVVEQAAGNRVLYRHESQQVG